LQIKATLYFLSGGPFLAGAAKGSCVQNEIQVEYIEKKKRKSYIIKILTKYQTLSIKSLCLSGTFLSVIMNSSCCLSLSSSQRCKAS